MGRGSSGAGGASAKLKAVTSVTTQDGTVLDLTGNPLKYGSLDPALSPAQRATIEAQEAKRTKMKTEYGFMCDANGNAIGERHGGKGSVSTPTMWWMNADNVYTHNHPRGSGTPGCLGGTFSDGDIAAWSGTKVRTMRASAAEGTYSITKQGNFNAKGLRAYFKASDIAGRKKMDAAQDAAHNEYKAGKIGWDEYVKRHYGAFNTFLVEQHNALLAGQKQYGYTYTLEGKH